MIVRHKDMVPPPLYMHYARLVCHCCRVTLQYSALCLHAVLQTAAGQGHFSFAPLGKNFARHAGLVIFVIMPVRGLI